MSETIAAISTPQGRGGIGTVRISGENAREIGDRVFKAVGNKTLATMAGYTAAFGRVFDLDGRDVDEAVALVFSAPNSYTGEDVVELSVHGGEYVTRACLKAVISAGARPAAAGEFTLRAFKNGKLDLSQAESVMSLIGATGEQELRRALAAKDGRIAKETEAITSLLLECEAYMAVWSDYPDEELPETDIGRITALLSDVRDRLKNLIKNYDTGKLLRDGVATAIVGAPNTGKSTLMNLLSGSELSIVTDIAGTTRDIVEDTVRLGGVLLRLADTAGVRSTDDTVEAIGVSRALSRAETAQLVLGVFDASRPLGDDDLRIIPLLKNRPAIAVINKQDIENAFDASPFDGIKTVFVSAKDGTGIDALAAAVSDVTGESSLSADATLLQSERQRSCALRALDNMNEAFSALTAGYSLDAVNICVDDALSALLELTGQRVTDAVVDEVFSRFCVGK